MRDLQDISYLVFVEHFYFFTKNTHNYIIFIKMMLTFIFLFNIQLKTMSRHDPASFV